MQNRKGLALVLAFVVALSAAGCGQKAAPAEKAPLVKTQQAGSGMEADTGTYAAAMRRTSPSRSAARSSRAMCRRAAASGRATR